MRSGGRGGDVSAGFLREPRQNTRDGVDSLPMPTDPPLAPPGDLVDALHRCVPRERVLTRTLERVAFASDASFYRLMPEAVVFASSVEEVQQLFALSRSRGIPLTFRAAGTSLSGQSQSDGLLVEVARHWRGANGRGRGPADPGAPGDHRRPPEPLLRPFGRKIGPDPACIRACTMGGILANNRSGMCCGVDAERLPHARLADLRAALGDVHRHRRRRRGRGASGRASLRCPGAARRCATRSRSRPGAGWSASARSTG